MRQFHQQLLGCLLWSGLTLPLQSTPTVLHAGDSPDVVIAESVETLLRETIRDQVVGETRLTAAYDSAQAEIGNPHPFLEYAYGLALAKNFLNDRAEKHFENAARSGKPLVLPAREDAIRNGILDKKTDEALEGLVDISATLGGISPTSPTFADAQVSAEWLGRIMAYLEGPYGDLQTARKAHKNDPIVRGFLGKALESQYKAGRSETVQIQLELMKKLAFVEQKVRNEKREDLDQTNERYVEVAQEQESLRKATTEKLDAYQEELADLDTKLEAMEKLYEQSLASEQQLSAAVAMTTLELQSLSRLQNFGQTNPQFPSNISGRQRFRNSVSIQEKQAELVVMQLEQIRLLESRRVVVGQGEALARRRQHMLGNADAAAGQASEQLAKLESWKTRLERNAAELSSQTPETSSLVQGIQRRIRSLNTYDPRSVDSLRDRLIAITQAAVQP
ncbi:MAG: hypothetical protein KDA80_04030 [Planctomycetaceae bacterium]|nr:hypothetical protein [Planctomycetaceae bacterium]